MVTEKKTRWASFLLSLGIVTGVMNCAHAQTDDDLLYDTFREGFMWGTATAAYQIEGAWNTDGKGENIWDRYSHTDGNVLNNDNGDVACDSYNKYEEDVQLLKDMGVTHYRFSISWARVLPNGTSDGVSNEVGWAYYDRLIDALLAVDIKPMVTLYHWDLPQALQDIGGWENREMVQHFANYSRMCFERYGDRVKWWITFNEPFVFVWIGYGIGVHAPGIGYGPGTIPYRVAHHVLLSHAEAYHIYDQEFRTNQKGNIFITLDSDWKEGFNQSDPADVAAGEKAMTFKLGWFANAIFGDGDYPELMKEIIAEKSSLQGFNESRLPEFTPEEVQRIKGTSDYFGLNHYTTQLIRPLERPIDEPSYSNDQDVEEIRDPSWPTTGSSWHRVVPWGLRKLLVYIKNNYNNPPVIITENGVSDKNGTLDDGHRVYFYKHYINNALKAYKEDGCDVRAYTAWSLLDNFEWGSGYSEKFGLHYVDFDDDNRPRKAKESASYIAQLIQDNGFIDRSSAGETVKISTFSVFALAVLMVINICPSSWM